MHIRPIRDEDGVGGAGVADDVEEAPVFIVAEGGLIPVGFGNRDDAVETSLFIDRSDGVGDGARASAASVAGVNSLIVFFFSLFLD